MERSDGSNKMAVCKEVFCSLMMLFLGLLFCLSLAALVYFSFQPIIVDGVTSCIWWLDIPGRLAIFLICFYLVMMCGFLPLPQRYYSNSFIRPFNVWRLRSWRRLFRNICFPIRSLINRLQRNATPIRNNPAMPLLLGNSEYVHDHSRWRTLSEPIDIRYPKSYVIPVFVSNPENTPRNETPEVKRSSNGSISSMGSSMGDFVVPIMTGKSSARYSTSGASIEESPDDRARVSSKYRKRYTEIKWMGDEATNARLPVTNDTTVVAEKPEMPTLENKSTALTDDDRLEISRQERRRLVVEMPEVHKNTAVLVPRLSQHDTLSRDESERLLEEKSVQRPEDEQSVAKRNPEIKPKKEMMVADEQIRVPQSPMSIQPRMQGRIKQPEGTTVFYKIKSPPKYREKYTETKDENTLAGVDDHAPVTGKQPSDNTYYTPTDRERHAIARQQESTTSTFQGSNLQAADEQIRVTPSPTSIQPRMQGRIKQPEGTTVFYKIKSPPKYKEKYTETKDENTLASVDLTPVTIKQPSDDTYFAPADDERHATARQQEPTTSAFQRSNLQAADEHIRVPTSPTGIQPRMQGRIKQPEGTTVFYKIKSPPKYKEIYTEIKNENTLARDDHAPVTRKQPSDKCFTPTDDERHATTRQQEPTTSTFQRSNLQAADGQIKVPTGKKLPTETTIKPATNLNNRKHGEATFSNEQEIQPKPRNIETRSRNFSDIRDKNEQPGAATANPTEVSNTTDIPNYPRFPWNYLRNPRGVSAAANKLHRKNLEWEKREMQRFCERQRRQPNLNRLVRELLADLSRKGVNETRQLPRSSQNIGVIARSSIQMKDFPTKCSQGQMEVRPKTGCGVRKDKICQTNKDQYELTEKQEVENMEKNHAKNQGPQLFSLRQDVERSNADESGAQRRRRLPSERYQARTRSLSDTQDKAQAKTDFKVDLHTRLDQKHSGQKALTEAGPSNLSKFEQDTERTGVLEPMTEEIADESFNRLQLEGLRRRTVPSEHRKQTNTEASATLEYKQKVDTKEVRTTDVSDKDSLSNVSTKPNKVKKPDVKITIDPPSGKSDDDSESGSEQSKK